MISILFRSVLVSNRETSGNLLNSWIPEAPVLGLVTFSPRGRHNLASIFASSVGVALSPQCTLPQGLTTS